MERGKQKQRREGKKKNSSSSGGGSGGGMAPSLSRNTGTHTHTRIQCISTEYPHVVVVVVGCLDIRGVHACMCTPIIFLFIPFTCDLILYLCHCLLGIFSTRHSTLLLYYLLVLYESACTFGKWENAFSAIVTHTYFGAKLFNS